MSAVTERVAAGAAFLDEHDPQWWREDVERAIDLEELRLIDSAACILGQRCPVETLAHYLRVGIGDLGRSAESERYYAYGHKLKKAVGDKRPLSSWAQDLGFSSNGEPFADLTAEWKRVIGERRAAS